MHFTWEKAHHTLITHYSYRTATTSSRELSKRRVNADAAECTGTMKKKKGRRQRENRRPHFRHDSFYLLFLNADVFDDTIGYSQMLHNRNSSIWTSSDIFG